MPTTPNPVTTEWVPLWNLGGGADMRYNGDYLPGSYTDGDIVVFNGVTYLCVRPTSAAPTPWTPPQQTPGYGTTLPASPVDGQEHVLVDSVTASTYQWRFRYNAASTSAGGYKWEFVGGFPYQRTVTGTMVGDSVFHDFTGSFTIPRTGEYLVDGGWWGASGGANCTGFVSVGINGTNAGNYGGMYVPSTGADMNCRFPSQNLINPAAGAVLTLQYWMNSGGSPSFRAGGFSILPKRVA